MNDPEEVLARVFEEALDEAVRRDAAMIDAKNRVLWRPEDQHG